MIVNLEEFADTASSDISGFNERLIDLLPGIKKHHCSPGYEGGFVERLYRGTYFAHIIEHIALELSEGAGIGVTYGKTIYDGAPGKYKVIVRYKCEHGMNFLLKSAVDIIRNVALNLPYDIEACLEEARSIVKENQLGPSTQAIVNAAIRRNIPWKRMNDQSLIQFGWGVNRKFIQATTTSSTSDISVDLAQDKYLTKRLLEDAFIKVPHGKIVDSVEDAIEFFHDYKGIVAIKPLDGNHGRGITLNIKHEEEIKKAFELAREHSSSVLIEECLKGNDYRLVFVGGKLIAAALRKPAHVVGNDELTVAQLIEKENINPLRGEDHEKPLTKIHLNAESETVLARQGLTLKHVPSKGQVVYLKETANLSTGGCAKDVTDEIHPEIKFMCERAARLVGLDICGIDFIAEDISKPLKKQVAGIIEVNAGPGLRMHQHPSFGQIRDVGEAIIENMFKDNDGRIPIVAITGTNGKTTVSRMLNHIFTQDGKCVGNTTSEGVYIGNQLVAEGDTTGPISARAVLNDPSVEIAILETARGGIVKRGLAFDYCDVGIFTNLKADHIGQDGIESIDDIMKIKRIVIEQVKARGTVILNADCPNVMSLTEDPRMDLKNKKVIYLSVDNSNSKFFNLIKDGAHGYYFKKGKIIEALGEIESIVANVEDIPLTMNGTAVFHVFNAMASIAAAHALKVSDKKIIEALNTFDQELNPGRTNLYKVKNGYLMLDYGHNPDALTSIGNMARQWNISTLTGVITAPGDRSDEMIRMSGLYAAYTFDKLIIREDEDLRGRTPGEVSNLLKSSAMNEKSSLDCQVILDSRMALQKAIYDIKDNELIVFFYDDLKSLEDIMKEAWLSKDIPPSLFIKNNKENRPRHVQESEWLQYSY
jgi:cyanophycin synthetase